MKLMRPLTERNLVCDDFVTVVGSPAPTFHEDLYATEAILDPYPRYAAIRQLGPVVWLTRQKVYALARYTECKAVLRNDGTVQSANGVALNAISNRFSRGNKSECPSLMVDYLGPALDTTISAISSALRLFATHPNQWLIRSTTTVFDV